MRTTWHIKKRELYRRLHELEMQELQRDVERDELNEDIGGGLLDDEEAETADATFSRMDALIDEQGKSNELQHEIWQLIAAMDEEREAAEEAHAEALEAEVADLQAARLKEMQ